MWGSEPFLRVASEQLIYISAAVGADLPSEADLYESGDTFALVGNLNGAYHLSTKSGGRNAKLLSSAGIVAYLTLRFGMELGNRFPAWSDTREGRAVVLFSRWGTRRIFDDSFSEVMVPYRKLVAGRVFLRVNQFLFPTQALDDPAGRCDFFETEKALVLRSSERGRFQLSPRANPRYAALDSQELMAFCHRRFGPTQHLRALRTEIGLYISKDKDSLYEAARRGAPHLLDVIPTPRARLTLNKKWTMYLSVEAGQALEGRISVLEHDGLLALRRESDGTLKVSPCAQNRYSISSKALKERIICCYPGCKYLNLVPYGDLMLLTWDGRCPEKLPPMRDFCRLELYQPKAGVSWLRIQGCYIELSRPACATLSGRFSIYVGPDALRLTRAKNGSLCVCKSKQTINSAALSRIVRDKFGLTDGDKLYAEQTEDGLLVWPTGCLHPRPCQDNWLCLDDQLMKPDRSLSALVRGNQVDFSVQAARVLGERVVLEREHNRIRVRNRADGPYRVHHKGTTGRKYIASAEAVSIIRRGLGMMDSRLDVILLEDGVAVVPAFFSGASVSSLRRHSPCYDGTMQKQID